MGSSCDDEVQQVPVAGSGVAPGYRMAKLGEKECIGDTEIMV